ncbi:MAG TPA: protein kinase, partial [Kofleriaceae bacterium]
MDHLAEQSVLDLAMGAMVEPAASAAHAHLDRCGDCRALVAQIVRGSAPALQGSSPDVASTVAEGPVARRSPASASPIAQLDEYRVVDLLGHGGMGTVYRAHDTLLDREVALKLIARTESEQARQRFLLEARAVARIRHPNVVTVHRVGITGEQPYIVYDLVRGHTFGQLPRPSPWPRVLELGVGIARGLAAAHA